MLWFSVERYTVVETVGDDAIFVPPVDAIVLASPTKDYDEEADDPLLLLLVIGVIVEFAMVQQHFNITLRKTVN